MHALANIQLGALRAVEAVARHGGLGGAAEELGVTPGAVSQRVLKAEAQLGRRLFERHARGLVPTRLGAEVAHHLEAGFAELARGVEIARGAHFNAITLSVAPVFASKWLIWRLHRFAEAHPGLRLRIDADIALTQPGGDVDACIRVGRGGWQGVKATKLMDQIIFPVCAPALAAQVTDISDLAHMPVILDPEGFALWKDWLGPQGAGGQRLCDGPVFSDAALCLDAAIAGHGVFLAWEPLASDAIRAGQLVAPLPGRYPNGIAYWFIEPEGRPTPRNVADVRDWLASELQG